MLVFFRFEGKRTLARSIGWIQTEAKVAADPPQTKGSKALANATEDADVVVVVTESALTADMIFGCFRLSGDESAKEDVFV